MSKSSDTEEDHRSDEQSSEGPGTCTRGIVGSALSFIPTEKSSEGLRHSEGITGSVVMADKRGTKRKLESHTYERKYSAIMEVERGLKSKKQIAADFNIPALTLSCWIKIKDEIKRKFESGDFGQQRKKARTAKYPEVEEALIKWFANARSQNATISGEILREKAREFARKLGQVDFDCSVGWLERFKVRHSIAFKRVCGEANSVKSDDSLDHWKVRLAALLQDYEPSSIYNADETGLFFRMLPEKTYEFKSKKCHGGKQSKERVTVLVCSNMTGTDKLPLLVIGKSAQPRCFKNVKTLPTEYAANKKAWMTGEIFSNWLRKIDRQMTKQKKKIALIIDNCPAHPSVTGLQFVKLVFLPPNTTSVTQPMDQGVIHNLKTYYRKLVRQRQIRAIDNNTEFSVSLLDALRMLHQAWGCVTQTTIRNCFNHAGFKTDFAEPVTEDDPYDDIPLSRLAQIFGVVEMNDYITADDNLPTSEEITEDAIVQGILSTRNPCDENESDEEEDDAQKQTQTFTLDGAMNACDYLVGFFGTTENYETVKNVFLCGIECALTNIHLKKLCARQTDIKQFFSVTEDIGTYDRN